MLAPALWLLESLELALGVWLARHGHDRGLAWPAVVAALALLAGGWRALLVLASYRLAGLGWPGSRAWLGETLAFSRAYLAMTFAPAFALVDRRRRRRSAPGPLRIVFVHGWCCNGAVWRPLQRAWRRAGGPPPQVVTLAPVLGDLDRMARHLEACLARDGVDPRRILLVAHSMGGLVARRWLQDVGGARCAGLLTIGTPHSGTRVARWGPGLAARQMRVGSDWLQRLAALEAQSGASAPLACAWSATDGFVSPAASARPAGAESLELAGVGHFGMLRSPVLLEALQQLVGAALPRAAARALAEGR